MALTIDLTEKNVLITGGISGIGLGTAIQFAKAGAKVIVCAERSVQDEQVQAFYKELHQYSSDVYYYQTDVTNPVEIKQLEEEIRSQFGRLDILISNAGRNIFTTLANCDEETWNTNQKLNLESHWFLGKTMRPLLQVSGQGVIIVLSSNHAYSSIQGCFPYNVAKAALPAMVRAMAIEWTPSIRTVGIAPGFIDTPGNQLWFDSFEDSQKARADTIALHPVKRLGTPEEIGGWCVFLCSEYAAFANGTTYLIDGGRSALMQD
ncbi:SDR family NAD(P)-dependent oxidoreductase [Sphingobacterium spiritivorum]|uniref:SDR family NAD(P)-dependent oxidoreductase n=1 Tax=Sphingobacterium spiritivorum TaxID=258 RepID=UPI0019199241|nr:SDR family oxidoreductase [Sphingobacterium spiritivorum]QQT25711.1 SDR family oxidoreductase [Sphingobacterium spiritivorum]